MEADHNSHLVVEQVGEPGQDEGSPADAEDGGHVSGGQLAVGAPDNHHRDLASTALHHNQGGHGQSGEEVVIRKILHCICTWRGIWERGIFTLFLCSKRSRSRGRPHEI